MVLTQENIAPVRIGLALAIFTLLFGIFMGISFGIFEDNIKGWINAEVIEHPAMHDEKSASKIWRYAQRAHFHSTGIGAFTLGLILLVSMLDMRTTLKRATSILIGLGGVYGLGWFSMFLLAPDIGRADAHSALITEITVYIGVGSLLLGIAILCANLFLGYGSEQEKT